MQKLLMWQRRIRLRWSASLLLLMLSIASLATPQAALAEPETPGADGSIYMPASMKESCKELKSAGLLGVQPYGGVNSGSTLEKDLMESGASWVRLAFVWSQVEPDNTTPDKYDWAHTDALAALAYERCWPVVFLLTDNPEWASLLAEGPLTRAADSELAQFMGAMAERYDGDGVDDAPGSPKVFYFEMYNEPDAGALGVQERWGNYGDRYAAMLKAVYPAIKQANPQAQVVFGGIAFDFFSDSANPADAGPFVRKFFDDVLANGGGPYFDLMNYHFYPLFGWNWTKNFPSDGPGLLEKTEAVRAIMRKYNVDKPVIITEMGWHNNGDAPYGSNTLQVRMVQQLYTQAMAARIPMAAWWPLADPGGSYAYNSGLVTNGESGPIRRKPAYVAYQVFAREISSTTFVAEIAAGTDVKVYQFRDSAKNRTIYVAWTNPTDLATVFGSPTTPYKDTTRTTTVLLQGSAASVYDAGWNQVVTVTDAADGKKDGRVKITINGDPKYIVVEGL